MSNQQRKNLLLDSNLLLLLLIGSFDIHLIGRFKRVSSFSSDDFRLLRDFCRRYRIVTTPHVLTEVGNLANSLPHSIRPAFLRYMADVATTFIEQFTPFSVLSSMESFASFGITDTAVNERSASVLVLSEDARLRYYLQKQGHRAIGLLDLHHFRDAANNRIS